MKIVVIGKGTIGKHVIEALKPIADVISASRSSKEYPVDIEDKKSIEALFEKIGECDHVINVAGKTSLVPFEEGTDTQYENSFAGKLMGQINCVRVAIKHLKPFGSITLTTGYLSHVPVPTVAIPALVNAAIERFIVNVSIELKDRFRVNVVSPAMLQESMEAYGAGIFKDYPVVSGNEVGKAYRDMIESSKTGCVNRVGWRVEKEWIGSGELVL